MRRTKGYTQYRLGQLCRVHQSFISLIEKGMGLPNRDQAERLAAALNLDVERLLDKIDPGTNAVLPEEDEENEEQQAVGR